MESFTDLAKQAMEAVKTEDKDCDNTTLSAETALQSKEVKNNALPPFMTYIDKHLALGIAMHNKPPDTSTKCGCCRQPQNTSATTFLPLSPCGHWVHYNCLVFRASRANPHIHNRCPVCNLELFAWDGINVLTAAARSYFQMESENLAYHYYDYDAMMNVKTDSDQYNADCWVIELTIQAQYNIWKNQPEDSRHQWYQNIQVKIAGDLARGEYTLLNIPDNPTDGSPNLQAILFRVMQDLDTRQRPFAKWLQWSSLSGYLLFCTLVGIKMSRIVMDNHVEIVGSAGWMQFITGMRELQSHLISAIQEDTAEGLKLIHG